ncbi:hypothetical protein ABH959_005339 [Bacillus sp. RC51]
MLIKRINNTIIKINRPPNPYFYENKKRVLFFKALVQRDLTISTIITITVMMMITSTTTIITIAVTVTSTTTVIKISMSASAKH